MTNTERGENYSETGLQYDDVSAIQLEEIKEDDPDYVSALTITIFEDEQLSQEDIEKLVREKISKENWWLQKYWQEKGLPQEQLNVQLGDANIEVYNFGGFLEQRHIDELKQVMAIFSRIQEGKVFKKINYILVDNARPINPNNDEEYRGYGARGDKAIKIYPRAVSAEQFRIQGVSNLEGTLIHEFAHVFGNDTEFSNKWRQKFLWKERAQPKRLSDGSTLVFESEHPERCVTSYASLDPKEDICDSVVAALEKPELLDPERLRFLKETLLKDFDIQGVGEPSIARHSGQEIKLPRMAQPVKFRVEKLPSFFGPSSH